LRTHFAQHPAIKDLFPCASICRTPFTGGHLSINLNTKLSGDTGMDDKQILVLAEMLKAISHPFRLKILCLLQGGEMTVGEIRQAINTTDANISQHLAILRKQGITGTRKQANYIYNHIVDDRVINLIETMQGLFCATEE
jgi:DNA-binding transcriptional ArsR family regulator